MMVTDKIRRADCSLGLGDSFTALFSEAWIPGLSVGLGVRGRR